MCVFFCCSLFLSLFGVIRKKRNVVVCSRATKRTEKKIRKDRVEKRNYIYEKKSTRTMCKCVAQAK
jgi:hypothetical protein